MMILTRATVWPTLRLPLHWRRWAGAITLLTLTSIWSVQHAGTALIIGQEVEQPDAIVSLASHEWERLPETAALSRRAPNARVLLTLPVTINRFNCHDCAHRVDRLVADGVVRDRIELLERRVDRTRDEAEAFRQWAHQHAPRSVMVVTSPYHTARARAVFREALRGTGIKLGVHPAPADVDPNRWWAHSYDRWYVSYEWRARVFYLLRFGIW